jgi:hypothetical protein
MVAVTTVVDMATTVAAGMDVDSIAAIAAVTFTLVAAFMPAVISAEVVDSTAAVAATAADATKNLKGR